MKFVQHQVIGMALAATASAWAIPAQAADLAFSGSMTGLGVTAPDSTCQPAYPARGTITGATGTSTLGNLVYSHNICLNGAPGTSAGTFQIDFLNGSILGSMTGTATPSAIPLISDTLFNYLITSGTGAFLGASGSFTGIGTADTNFRPAHIAISFNGVVTAVPEPETWAMMLLGFAGIGLTVRRRATRALRPA